MLDPSVFFIVAAAVGLYMAWNIGANDVANAFGTPVGSGAITLRQAILLAAIFEFSGAFFAGSAVAGTIRGDIIRPDLFAARPPDFALGMLAALVGSSIWLNLATFFGQPVSTTHAIIGSVIGFGLMATGIEGVQWHKLGNIVASWFVSPVVGGACSFGIYWGIRRFVLHYKQPVVRARYVVPVGLACMAFVMLYSMLQKLFPKALTLTPGETRWLALTAGVVVANLGGILVWAIMRRRCQPKGTIYEQQAEVERFFSRLQVMDACYISFSHGANDVANAVGPLVGILHALKGSVTTEAGVPLWVLGLGGGGIVLGLATYGYKVLYAVGKKITEVTPTRGFAAEFSTATTVLVCSLLGLPISTTFVLVGAVMGVGLARGFGAIDLKVIRRIFLSWIITIPASALATVLVYVILSRCWR